MKVEYSYFKALLELAKIRITILVAMTTALGFILFSGGFSLDLAITILGIFLQACGSATVNHIQDIEIDKMMQRTSNRPLPIGKISKKSATVFAAILLITGSFILASISLNAMFLGILCAILYNVIYGPLKRITPFASIPGAIIGAIPPLAGWVAAGGETFSTSIIFVALFFLIWQIPHFWLLILFTGDEYRLTGLPSLSSHFNDRQLARITLIWIFATAIAGSIFFIFNLCRYRLSEGIITAGAILMFLSSCYFLLSKTNNNDTKKGNYRTVFMIINSFALLIVLILSIDRLIG